jgi:hypothetical protein
LNEDGQMFDKTHDLPKLLSQVAIGDPSLMALQPQALFLTDFAVLYRYPGRIATKAQTQRAIKDCREVRRVIRTALVCLFNGSGDCNEKQSVVDPARNAAS